MHRKLTLVGSSKPMNKLATTLKMHGEKYGYKHHYIQRDLNSQALFDLDDMWHLKNTDAIVIFGTWGSTHVNRQWRPGLIERQARLNFLNQTTVELAELYHIPLIVIESSTLSRIRHNYVDPSFYANSNHVDHKSIVPRYYRIGMGHWTYGRTTWPHPTVEGKERLERFRKEVANLYKVDIPFHQHKWRYNPDGKVLICPGLEHDPTSNQGITDWLKELLSQIPRHTQRKIAIKPHPKSQLNYKELLKDYEYTLIGTDKKLKDIRDEIYCGVLDSSTSVFELLDLGIPCVTSRTNFGAPFGNTELKDIDRLKLPTKEFYYDWCVEMAHTEFTLEEFSRPKIFQFISSLF